MQNDLFGDPLNLKLISNRKDPFLLPEDQNVLISFSGGRTSAYMLYRIYERNGGIPDNVQVVFANTGREFPETLDFVKNVGDDLGIDIVWLEYDTVPRKSKDGIIATDKKSVSYRKVNRETASMDGEPFEKSVNQSAGGNYLPNLMQRFCTSQMKVLTIKRYLVKECGWKEWAAAIGIRSDESRRVKPSKDNRQIAWYPMFDAGVDEMRVLEFWKKMPFDLELTKRSPNGKSVLQGNCDCCFLKSEESLAWMYKLHPERFAWWEQMEEKTGARFHKDRSYKQLREKIDDMPNAVFKTEGFFCQVGGGECTAIDIDDFEDDDV